MQIMTISGSLRAQSRNTALLQACAQLAPAGMTLTPFTALAFVPPFNPDLAPEQFPVLQRWLAELRAVDAVLVASPEYAHGVSGVLKNALDWLVGTDVLVHKPLALLNAAPRARHAYEALQETLQLMSVDWIAPASLTIPVVGDLSCAEAIAADPACRAGIQQALSTLQQALLPQRILAPVWGG